MTAKYISVIGGDMRQASLARRLAQIGFDVRLFGIDIYNGDFGGAEKCAFLDRALADADFVILPLPAGSGGIYVNAPFAGREITIDEVVAKMPAKAILFGGMISQELACRLDEKKIKAIDYYEREELAVMNAIPTAEGAIAIAMEELPITLNEMKAAVLGFGRVANILSHRLSALGVSVTVYARRLHSRAWARAYGYEAREFGMLGESIADKDCVFNTVPELVLDKQVLEKMRTDTLIIDLASKPGGVDLAFAHKRGIKAISALSLPGRVAPHTAGAYIADTIMNIIRELENGGEI